MAHTRSIKAGPAHDRKRSGKADGPGFRPNKRLGQHFLVDRKIIHKIITRARFQASDLVLEIGPGQGSLTLPLARTVCHVVAVEKDRNLTLSLEKKLHRSGITNVTLVNADILKWDFREIESAPSSKIQVIGNLPYNISSPFLKKLIENRHRVARAVLMFQLEVGRRITACPGGKAYGAMSLLVQYHARPTALIDVTKEAFYPRPKVDSMVLDLDFESPYPKGTTVHEPSFRQVVKGAFAHRRKTLINSLSGVPPSFNRDVLLAAMKKCEIDPGRRAETLDMEEFLCLAEALSLTNRSGNDS
ncbi:MAG: ribosomal RNA small subunit methyltransferase A [Deltaproteobacteria bacterium]|nr:ribosomal RNA small subunit methyltransferase A [Deltaproteobacteria bacterium]MBW2168984.1 ribosomal RNA small subunit methyltransferase A [Deltaproteobacteria bacterium]